MRIGYKSKKPEKWNYVQVGNTARHGRKWQHVRLRDTAPHGRQWRHAWLRDSARCALHWTHRLSAMHSSHSHLDFIHTFGSSLSLAFHTIHIVIHMRVFSSFWLSPFTSLSSCRPCSFSFSSCSPTTCSWQICITPLRGVDTTAVLSFTTKHNHHHTIGQAKKQKYHQNKEEKG